MANGVEILNDRSFVAGPEESVDILKHPVNTKYVPQPDKFWLPERLVPWPAGSDRKIIHFPLSSRFPAAPAGTARGSRI